jgi:hypothetical protein
VRSAEPPKRRTVEASTRCAFFAESLEEKNLITSYQEKELWTQSARYARSNLFTEGWRYLGFDHQDIGIGDGVLDWDLI